MISSFSLIIIQPFQYRFPMKYTFALHKFFFQHAITDCVLIYWPTASGSIHKSDILSKMDRSANPMTSIILSGNLLYKEMKTFTKTFPSSDDNAVQCHFVFYNFGRKITFLLQSKVFYNGSTLTF